MISPYARAGYVGHGQGEFSSLAKYIEETFGVPSLGGRDSLAQTSDLSEFFDYNQVPLPAPSVTAPTYSPALVVPQPNDRLGTGITGAVTPAVGRPSTIYQFDVGYLPSTGTPTVHNVLIDGQTHEMTQLGVFGQSKSRRYEYSTTLSTGTHSFRFDYRSKRTAGHTASQRRELPGPEVTPLTDDYAFRYQVWRQNGAR